MEQTVVLSLGSNIGDRAENLVSAVDMIGERCGKIIAVSKVYETEPWGTVEGVDGQKARAFLNQAVKTDTCLGPLDLLNVLKSIEVDMGRVYTDTPEKGGQRSYLSRIIDIDIIFYGGEIIDDPRLTVPHPLMAKRSFVLRPVAEIAADMRHPLTGLTAGEMLDALDSNATERYEEV